MQINKSAFAVFSWFVLAVILAAVGGYAVSGHSLIRAMYAGEAPIRVLNRVVDHSYAVEHYLNRGDWALAGFVVVAALFWLLCAIARNPASFVSASGALRSRKKTVVVCAAAILLASVSLIARPLGPWLLFNLAGIWIAVTLAAQLMVRDGSPTSTGRAGYLAAYAVILGFCVWFLAVDRGFLSNVFDEDTFFENLTFLLHAYSGILLIVYFWRRRRRRLPVREDVMIFLFGLFFLFIAGEEISWGQRVFFLETPEFLKERNYQEEINLHNLRAFDAPTIEAVILFILAVIVPITQRWVRPLRAVYAKFYFPSITPMTVLALLTGFIIALFPGSEEMRELYMGLGFLALSFGIYFEGSSAKK